MLSLYFGWLDCFFYSAEYAQIQGVDYFAVPKSYLNLVEGKSAFDTWGGAKYGPYATWYLAHPAFSVFVASWFSFFSAWTSYWLFVFFSIGIMSYAAFLFSKSISGKLNRQLVYFIMLCSFPVYWMLYVGNMHAPLVLALSLIFLGVLEEINGENDNRLNKKLFFGLLISFFSKPIVLLMLPVLLLVKETRKTTFYSLLIYGFVSFMFIVVPALNPEAVGLNKLMNVVFDFDYIKSSMNIYKNNFVLNEYMKDNSIHWLNLIAQSDYKLLHVDVFSLPVFIDTLIGKEVSAFYFKMPIYLTLLLSFFVPFIANKKSRIIFLLMLLMAISLTFFLSYNTVWEYQFASVLPVIATLIILKEKNLLQKRELNFLIVIGCLVCLPTLYFLVDATKIELVSTLTLIRFLKVVPVLVLFLVIVYGLLKQVLNVKR
ncbi:MAG: hypothetical protein JNL69_10000 [Bacteroidia bacterium]|nr:hypothetical protein [Bacteroidia bacterium]